MGLDLKSEMLDTVIDYNKVDVLPSFSFCDSIMNVEKKNRCFKNNLYKHLSSFMLSHTFEISKEMDEMVHVKLMIDNKGKAKLIGIKSSSIVREQLPMLDSIINESIQTLPKFSPAQKRGIPVPTVYEIPIVIKLE